MSIRRITFLLFLALVACAPLAAQPSGCPQGSPSVNSAVGPICGVAFSTNILEAGTFTANAYRGIPYAQPPVGERRWQNPVASNPWTVPFPATQFAKKCPQAATITDRGCSFKTSDQSEDCLYLNVWTPTGVTPSLKLPVLVFMHGGGFLMGTGGTDASDLYDGTYLAASQNVVVVTFNYRLGVLGFLATHAMSSGAGNFGFSDQLMALNWVHRNIASFGGDPNQVMLFGESAGAMSVGLHALSSPQSAGLFKAALMESNPLGIPYKTLQQAWIVGDYFSKQVDCSNLQCLQQKSACELVAREDFLGLELNLSIPARKNIFHWTPVIDGNLISDQPIANASNLKVPVLMGTNRDEGLAFATLAAGRHPQSVKGPGYNAELTVLFGANKLIQEEHRYACGVLAPDCTQQWANVITDAFFTCANRRLAIEAGSAQNLYMYLFNQATSFNFWEYPNPLRVPDCFGKVCHADELPYVFNTASAMDKTFGRAEEALSQRIGGYWASFARSQSPGGDWRLFNPDKTYLMLNNNPSNANKTDPLYIDANCTLWDKIGYQSKATWDRLLAEVKAPKQKPAH